LREIVYRNLGLHISKAQLWQCSLFHKDAVLLVGFCPAHVQLYLGLGLAKPQQDCVLRVPQQLKIDAHLLPMTGTCGCEQTQPCLLV
jgi:hypothetical protein